jgi:hypothetical protein
LDRLADGPGVATDRCDGVGRGDTDGDALAFGVTGEFVAAGGPLGTAVVVEELRADLIARIPPPPTTAQLSAATDKITRMRRFLLLLLTIGRQPSTETTELRVA